MSRWTSLAKRDAGHVFQDRREAGRVLARELASYRSAPAVLVLGLARGGVPVAWEVASYLAAELDVFLVRKLGVPNWPELAMGALATGGGVLINKDLVGRLDISEHDVDAAIERETRELNRRETAYRGDRADLEFDGKTVILVDDGVATGASMLVAVRAVRKAARLVVAVPVGPDSACRQLAQEADEVVCTSTPPEFEAVGQAYADFRQVSDEEVRRLLATPTTG